jgi:hypothetical protein
MLFPLLGGEDQGEGELFSPQALISFSHRPRDCRPAQAIPSRAPLNLTINFRARDWPNPPASGGRPILNRDARRHIMQPSFYHGWGNPHSRCCRYFRSFRKKWCLFPKMLSNSIKNASEPANLPFSPPQTIQEPQTRHRRRADPFGPGSSGSVGARILVARPQQNLRRAHRGDIGNISPSVSFAASPRHQIPLGRKFPLPVSATKRTMSHLRRSERRLRLRGFP